MRPPHAQEPHTLRVYPRVSTRNVTLSAHDDTKASPVARQAGSAQSCFIAFMPLYNSPSMIPNTVKTPPTTAHLCAVAVRPAGSLYKALA